MPLPQPILDDRSYQQLRDELVRRIPVYAPEWTDYNASDPGITLIELFSFLGENLLFRFNQIPETTKLAVPAPARRAAAAGGGRRGLRHLHDAAAGGRARRPADDRARGQRPVPDDRRGGHLAAVGARRRTDAARRAAARGGGGVRTALVGRVPSRDAQGGAGHAPLYYATQVLGDDPTAPGAEALDLPGRSTGPCGWRCWRRRAPTSARSPRASSTSASSRTRTCRR